MRTRTKMIAGGGVILAALSAVLLHRNVVRLPITVFTHSQYPVDMEDDRQLVGISHNVFVGKVLRKTGQILKDEIPYTQFEVAIIDNIKGNLRGIVTVTQETGYRNGILYIEDGDTPLARGSTYLFAARGNDKDSYYIGSHPRTRKLISSDEKADAATLRILAENDMRIRELKEAYKNEVVPQVDILSGNDLSRYQPQ